MIYVFEDTGDEFTVQAPDDLDHEIATKVISANEDGRFELKGMVKDDDYTFPPSPDDEPDLIHQPLTDIITPNLFIDCHEDTGRLVPDMDYMNLVDKDFMEDMLYHWTKSDRKEWSRMLDEMEENLDELLDSCLVIDIIQ